MTSFRFGFLKKAAFLLLCMLLMPALIHAYEFDKNITIVSYDISGTMGSKFVPDEVHTRIQKYLKYILGSENGYSGIESSTGWKTSYLSNSNDSEVVSLPSNHWLTKKGLMANDSGCIFITFGDKITQLAEYEIGTSKRDFNLCYPKAFKDQNTIFENLIEAVKQVANYAANKQANCYWISVTDDVEDTNGVGGGHSNEAFNKFCSEKYYKPVLHIKLNIPQKENRAKKDWQVYINVNHIADLSIAIKDYSNTMESLEKEITELSMNPVIADSSDFLECKYKLDDLKLNTKTLMENPTDLNTANTIEKYITELRAKLKSLHDYVNKLNAYSPKIKSLRERIDNFRNQYGNTDKLESIEKDLQRVEDLMAKLESSEISKNLFEVEKGIKELEVKTAKEKGNEAILQSLSEKETAALNPVKELYKLIDQSNKNSGQLATKTTEITLIGQVLEQLENSIPNQDEKKFFSTLDQQKTSLEQIKTDVAFASKPNEYKRLLECEKKLETIINNPNIKTEIKEALKKQFDAVKLGFLTKTSAEIDTDLRKLEYELISNATGNTGSAAIVLLLVIIIAAIAIFINTLNKKPYTIVVSSKQTDNDEWEKPKDYTITTITDSNRIVFSSDANGMTYPYIESSYVIERRGSKLYLVKGSFTRLIQFGVTNSLQDSDAKFMVTLSNNEIPITPRPPIGGTTQEPTNPDNVDF